MSCYIKFPAVYDLLFMTLFTSVFFFHVVISYSKKQQQSSKALRVLYLLERLSSALIQCSIFAF